MMKPTIEQAILNFESLLTHLADTNSVTPNQYITLLNSLEVIKEREKKVSAAA